MKNTLTKLAAAGALALTATASAFAGSVTQPGETVGVAAGAPLPPGFYFVDTTDWGRRDTAGGDVDVGVTIPVLAWSTPWTVLGARVQFLLATPAVTVHTPGVHGINQSAVYNPLLAGQLAWDLGGGFGFSYMLGAYIGVETFPGVIDQSTSINQRFALSYTANGWNLTANTILGTQLNSTSVNSGTVTPNPDFINVDLTATKKFGNWELGAVGFYSTDINDPVAGYARQSQFALGGLVGYNFGPVIAQAYLTHDVYQKNYGGEDTRVWGRLIIPLGNPFGTPAPTGPIYKK